MFRAEKLPRNVGKRLAFDNTAKPGIFIVSSHSLKMKETFTDY